MQLCQAQRELWHTSQPAEQGALHIHLCLSTGELWCEQEMLLRAAHPFTDLCLCLSELEDPFPIDYNRKSLGSYQALLSPFPLHIPWVRVMLTRGSGPFHPGALGQLQHFACSHTQDTRDKLC